MWNTIYYKFQIPKWSLKVCFCWFRPSPYIHSQTGLQLNHYLTNAVTSHFVNSFPNVFVVKFDGEPTVKRSLPQCRVYSLNETAFSSAFVGISRVYQWCEQRLGWHLTVSNTGGVISLFLCYSQCSSYRRYIFLSLSYIPNIFSITFHLNNKSESKSSPDLRHFPVPMLCFHRG